MGSTLQRLCRLLTGRLRVDLTGCAARSAGPCPAHREAAAQHSGSARSARSVLATICRAGTRPPRTRSFVGAAPHSRARASASGRNVVPTYRHGGELSTAAGRGRRQDRPGWLDGQDALHKTRRPARHDQDTLAQTANNAISAAACVDRVTQDRPSGSDKEPTDLAVTGTNCPRPWRRTDSVLPGRSGISDRNDRRQAFLLLRGGKDEEFNCSPDETKGAWR